MRRTISGFACIFMVLSALFVGVGCSSDEKKTNTPEEAFAEAEKLDKDERYEEAITKYQEVKNKFPYSRLATQAELAIADVYFKQESYPEAQIAYQTFKDLHPKHHNSDYVTYQLALSFYRQLPKTIDRDLSLAPSAITFFEEVYKQFPNSQYAILAKDFRLEALKKMAEKELYIADFYFQRGQWQSALGRYESLLEKFSGMAQEETAFAKGTLSAARLGDMDKARSLLKNFQNKFPQSAQLEAVKKEVK